MNKSMLLVILDGWGIGASWGGNAITIANTLNYDRILRKYPNTQIRASGKFVGLPGDEVGNSEVGHMNIGAGNVVWQDISRINKSIIDKSFYENKVLLTSLRTSIEKGSSVHLMGIISDGGIHSHIVHLLALLQMCQMVGHKNVYIHGFTDGRDTDTMEGVNFINVIMKATQALQTGKIATISGRTYLDRNGTWGKTKILYDAIANGIGISAANPLSAISSAYKKGETDEYVSPIIIDGVDGRVKPNDLVIFFNFRSDRTRQLTSAFLDPKFEGFQRKLIENLDFISFIPYGSEKELGVITKSAFESVSITQTIGKYFADLNLRQFHIAETEKYAHVTFFVNGNRNEPYPLEDRVLVPSPKVKSYDLKPEMSADEVKNNLFKYLQRDTYSFTICNFANPDMVGHTGNFQAAVKAVEVIDRILREVVDFSINKGIPLLITADHGNIEQMVDPQTGNPYTEHTDNPVPVIVVDESREYALKEGGKLANIASTCIELSGREIDSNFKESLLIKKPT
jgi:2,3-bisphosphoglycerate-independent phosphoglycerate mutase